MKCDRQLSHFMQYAFVYKINFERRLDMKCYAQVYVMNSMEAVETYCSAFGAEVTFEIKNDAQTTYEHCELSVNNEGILAV
ncbi:hypothetical protein D7V86_21405 [bacterium D16-51]|nr:hypothetical protein D7V96_21690 [bacterium D16-59]RKI55623.1 hypothetical protein D7V86_21405 [bacterium D16-51]